jgi:hypothetical protein
MTVSSEPAPRCAALEDAAIGVTSAIVAFDMQAANCCVGDEEFGFTIYAKRRSDRTARKKPSILGTLSFV